MKAKLLKKLREKYSNDYSIIHCFNYWKIIYKDNYIFTPEFKTREEALDYIRCFVNAEIRNFVYSRRAKSHKTINKKICDVTSKMLYG